MLNENVKRSINNRCRFGIVSGYLLILNSKQGESVSGDGAQYFMAGELFIHSISGICIPVRRRHGCIDIDEVKSERANKFSTRSISQVIRIGQRRKKP